MKLEDQVCSLELSRRLRKLGVKQESLYLWVEINDTRAEVASYEEMRGNMPDKTYIHSAFTVAELGHIFPKYYYTFSSRFYDGKWMVQAIVILRGIGAAVMPPIYTEKAKTEADARAKMLIYLLENNLITL